MEEGEGLGVGEFECCRQTIGVELPQALVTRSRGTLQAAGLVVLETGAAFRADLLDQAPEQIAAQLGDFALGIGLADDSAIGVMRVAPDLALRRGLALEMLPARWSGDT